MKGKEYLKVRSHFVFAGSIGLIVAFICTFSASVAESHSSLDAIDPHKNHPSMQSGCDDDSVDTVSNDGTILKTLYGHIYDIVQGAIDVELWLSADDLLVCPTSRLGIYRIINTDESNEVAYGKRLR